MQPVEIRIDGNQQAIGRIDRTEIGDDGTAIMCQCRDYISDMVECNVDPTLKIKEGMTLAQAIIEAAGPVGIVEVLDAEDFALRDVRTGRRVGGEKLPGFKAAKMTEFKPQPNEGIYQFCNKMAARFGATIQPTSDRSKIQLTAPHYESDPLYSIVVSDDDAQRQSNNVLKATASRDFSNFPTFALFTAKNARAGKKQTTAAAQIDTIDFINTSRFGQETNRLISDAIVRGRRKPADLRGEGGAKLGLGKLYRLLSFRDDQSRNISQAKRAVARAYAERFKNTLIYTCTLRGHSDPLTGGIYSVDTIADVKDEIRNVVTQMWVASRTFRYSATAGATTDLTLWRKGALKL